jgi:hypothetical protein
MPIAKGEFHSLLDKLKCGNKSASYDRAIT